VHSEEAPINDEERNKVAERAVELTDSDTPPVSCLVCNAAPCNKEAEYFGVCPTCHKNDGYINIGTEQWFICEAHKVMWCIGSDVFSGWMSETEVEQRALREKLGIREYKLLEDEVLFPTAAKGESTDDKQTECFDVVDELDVIEPHRDNVYRNIDGRVPPCR
jgi:hypothetical protein